MLGRETLPPPGGRENAWSFSLQKAFCSQLGRLGPLPAMTTLSAGKKKVSCSTYLLQESVEGAGASNHALGLLRSKLHYTQMGLLLG